MLLCVEILRAAPLLGAVAALPDARQVVLYALCLAPALLPALLVAAAWFCLDDRGDRLRRYR